MCIWLIRVFLLKGMISRIPNLQAKKACILCLHFGESQFLGTYSCKISITDTVIVFSRIPHHIFVQIPNLENTLPDPEDRCSSWRGVYSNGTYLLIRPPWHLLILACHSRSAPHPPRLIGHYQFQQMVLVNSKVKENTR